MVATDVDGRAQPFVSVGGRHSDIHHRDVGTVLGHRGEQRLAVGHGGAYPMATVGEQPDEPSRIIAASSAITTRMFRMLSRVRRQPDADAGRPAGWAGDIHVAVDGTDSMSESGQASAAGRVGPPTPSSPTMSSSHPLGSPRGS